MKILFVLISFIVGNVNAQTSYVPPTKTLLYKGYQLGVSGDYFNSTKRIDKDNNKFTFDDGTKFSRLQGEVLGSYGLTNQFQIGAGARFRQNASTALNNSNETETKTSTGVHSISGHLLYAFKPVDRLYYSIEALYRYVPYTNSEVVNGSEENLILGDDGNEYSAGVGVTYASRTNNYLTARGGFRVPGTEMSQELYWQVEAALVWKHVALVAGVDGVSSLNNDPYEKDPQNKPVFNRGNTELYNSINREWIAPYAGLNIAFGKNWRVELKGSQTVSGRSTDLGTTFGISLIRRVEDSKLGALTDKKFKEYQIEASVSKVSPKKAYVVIDKGLADDIQKGLQIDFFENDYIGGNILLARGIVIQVKASSAIVKITQTFNAKIEIKPGTVARASLR